MAADYSICLGTAGWGVWHSPDAVNSWVRHRAPFPLNSRIQALVAHPTQARTIFAGGDTGVFVAIFGKPGGPVSGFGTGPGEFQLPYGCAVDDRRGHLWVADTKNNRAVQLTTDGIFIRNWGANGGDGTAGEGPAEFDEPYNAGNDCRGNVYISDEHSKRIEVFGDPGDPPPVCPPGLTISGAQASLGKRLVEVDAACDRICRVVGRVTVRDSRGRLVSLASRPVVWDDTDIVHVAVRIPSSVAKRLKRGARVSLRVTASGAPGADRVRPKSLKLGA